MSTLTYESLKKAVDEAFKKMEADGHAVKIDLPRGPYRAPVLLENGPEWLTDQKPPANAAEAAAMMKEPRVIFRSNFSLPISLAKAKNSLLVGIDHGS